ncbi:HalOD1 output domain-containing protein [Halostagnicola bangensis]
MRSLWSSISATVRSPSGSVGGRPRSSLKPCSRTTTAGIPDGSLEWLSRQSCIRRPMDEFSADVDPVELERPLYEVIDPDALDALIFHHGQGWLVRMVSSSSAAVDTTLSSGVTGTLLSPIQPNHQRRLNESRLHYRKQ